MLTIRKDTMAVMGDAMAARFEDRVLTHLQKFFPAKCKTMGEPLVRQHIQAGISRAARYECTTEQNIVRYIDLMFLIRPDFDASRATPWARRILADKTLPLDGKFRKLHFTAKRYGYLFPPPAK